MTARDVIAGLVAEMRNPPTELWPSDVAGWADRLESALAHSGEAVFQCGRCPVSVVSRWLEPTCPECGDPCALDPTAKPQAPPATLGGLTEGLPPDYYLFGLVGALRHQQQCDETGEMCIISRQAADEAASILEKLARRLTAPATGGLTGGEREALERLESRLTNGDFYSDYDNDWALVGKLREVIRRLAAPATGGLTEGEREALLYVEDTYSDALPKSPFRVLCAAVRRLIAPRAEGVDGLRTRCVALLDRWRDDAGQDRHYREVKADLADELDDAIRGRG